MPAERPTPVSSDSAPAEPAGVDAPARLTLAPGEQPETDLEVKRSHFLARAERADDEDAARAFIARIRSCYPDARHHCSAFIVPQPGTAPGAPAVERSSDDGEPSSRSWKSCAAAGSPGSPSSSPATSAARCWEPVGSCAPTPRPPPRPSTPPRA